MPKKLKKETIIPPSKKSVKQAARETPKGSSPGGRVLAEQKIAKQEGAKRKPPKK